jgi:hypothetical protein
VFAIDLVNTQPPIQWIQRSERDANHSTPSNTEVRIARRLVKYQGLARVRPD